MKPISAGSEAALREAMGRLFAGRARVTDGRFTVANLAREAGVGRSTANRAVDILDAFRAGAARTARRSTPAAEMTAARTRDAAEIGRLKATIDLLAQQLQRLALRDAEQRRMIEALRTAIEQSTAGRVVPFPADLS
jgi:chromosome segregation ATPase